MFTGKGDCQTCHGENLLGDATVDRFNQEGPLNEDGGSQRFHNVGVRPTFEDLNLGRFEVSRLTQDRGAHKTPVLRNLELTAPYFHTGAYVSLAGVVDFYNRGGDFRNAELGRRVNRLGLSFDDALALTAFLGRPLTDQRVACRRAPFDHPWLKPPNGAPQPAVGVGGLDSADC